MTPVPITKEMVKKVMEMYPTTKTREASATLGITEARYNFIINCIRRTDPSALPKKPGMSKGYSALIREVIAELKK